MTNAAPTPPAGGLTYLRIVEQLGENGVTQAEIAEAVGASLRTVQNWAAGDAVPTGVRMRRLLDLQHVVQELRGAYTDQGVQIWLHSRNANLNGRRPMDLLTSGEADRVVEEAERLSGGM